MTKRIREEFYAPPFLLLPLGPQQTVASFLAPADYLPFALTCRALWETYPFYISHYNSEILPPQLKKIQEALCCIKPLPDLGLRWRDTLFQWVQRVPGARKLSVARSLVPLLEGSKNLVLDEAIGHLYAGVPLVMPNFFRLLTKTLIQRFDDYQNQGELHVAKRIALLIAKMGAGFQQVFKVVVRHADRKEFLYAERAADQINQTLDLNTYCGAWCYIAKAHYFTHNKARAEAIVQKIGELSSMWARHCRNCLRANYRDTSGTALECKAKEQGAPRDD